MPRHAKAAKRETTDAEMAEFVGRMIVNLGKRAGQNVEALALMPGLQQLLRDEYRMAGRELYESGVSLADIARYMTEVGHKMNRSAAQQQFSPTGQSYVRKRGGATKVVRDQVQKNAEVAAIESNGKFLERLRVRAILEGREAA